MDEQRYQIQWVEAIDHENEIVTEEVISVEGQDEDDGNHEEYLVGEEIISHAEMNSIPNSLHQIAAENLIYMAQDGHVGTMGDLIEEDVVEQVDNVDYNDQQYFECQVTEEVITDDWVQQQGEERVEIPVGQLCGSGGDGQIVEEMDVPLPTDQDEYTALRPYPCDFCSRRFRKKASLMNHMIAHQNDRPHVCNLCGARYIRRSDLLNHLKIHAHIPEQRLDDIDNDNFLNDHIGARTSRKYDYYDDDEDEIEERPKPKGRRKKMKIKQEERYSEHEHVNEEQQIQEQNIERYPITDPRKPFVCQQCGIAFAREKALLSHSRIHGGDSPYECATCNEMFWDMNMLHDHQRTHHFEASNSEYEPENDEETESETDSKYGEYYCDVCGMSFHRQDLLKRHTKTHVKMEFSEGDSKHCCNVCGETFLEALDLLAHAEIHARFQPFKCMLCGETFLEEATIKKHLTNVHSSEMTANTCRLCGKQCRDGRALMKHAWDHSREKNHSCSKCGKTFHNKARLKRHMVSHRNKSVICDVCQEEFPDGRSLMNHRHSHNNSSGKLFPCHECGKTFGSRSSQQIHVRIHTGERPYGCRFCWKAFADGGTLRKHERIHTGEKPYACSVCPRAFNQRVVLREHIRSHHSAPDTKRGTSLMPFYCTVCTDMFSTSVDLIQHLIQHSDMNTAIHRQPITGPRKYKRRRKLKQHELEQLRNEKSNTSDIDYSDLEMGNVDDLLGISSKSTTRRSNNNNNNNNNRLMTTSTYVPSSQSNRKRKYSHNSDKISSNNWQQKLMASTSTDDTYNSVFQNLENALQNIDSLVVNNNNNTNINNNSSQAISNVVTTPKTQKATRRRTNKHELIVEKPSRPKMIHTQKTRVTVEDGKRKTRTMITRTEPAEIDDNVLQQFDRSKTITERNYHDYELVSAEDPLKIHQNNSSSQIVIKQEQIQRSDIFDAQLLLEAASMRKELEKYNPDVVNDLEEILRSPIKLKRSPKISSSCGNCGIITTTPNSSTDLSIEYDKTERNIDYNNQPSDEVRRSSRIKKSVQNKKYLEFETSLMNKSPSTSSSSSTNRNQQNKIKQEKYDKIEIKTEKTDDNEQHHHRKSTERFFQCEMCCAVFPDRTQLLVHVPVHI